MRANSSLKRPKKTVICCGALLVLTPAAAFAQLVLIGTGNVQYQYDTNVFGLDHGAVTPLGNDIHDDSLVAYGGKLDATYLVSQQQFHFVVLGTEYRYDRFTLLNHSEYTLDGAWNLRFGIVDGLIEVDRNRAMINLYNLVNVTNGALQLALQTEQRETAKFGVAITPDWRVEAGGYYRTLESPLVETPDLALTEAFGEAAVKYTGSAGLTAGLQGGYLRGNFTGNTEVVNGVPVILVPGYTQYNVALTATKQISGLSTFIGQVGYSKRTASEGVNSAANSVSGVTFELDYRRALTGKTTIEANVSRVIATYLVGAGSEIDTIGTVNANWQATSKIGVTIGDIYTYRDLPHQGIPLGTNRTDRLNYIALIVEYQPTRWLSLRPYYNYQIRTSNFPGGDFNENVVGLKFSLQLQHGEPPPPQLFQVPPFQF
jgi:hypothetical protein